MPVRWDRIRSDLLEPHSLGRHICSNVSMNRAAPVFSPVTSMSPLMRTSRDIPRIIKRWECRCSVRFVGVDTLMSEACAMPPSEPMYGRCRRAPVPIRPSPFELSAVHPFHDAISQEDAQLRNCYGTLPKMDRKSSSVSAASGCSIAVRPSLQGGRSAYSTTGVNLSGTSLLLSESAAMPARIDCCHRGATSRVIAGNEFRVFDPVTSPALSLAEHLLTQGLGMEFAQPLWRDRIQPWRQLGARSVIKFVFLREKAACTVRSRGLIHKSSSQVHADRWAYSKRTVSVRLLAVIHFA
ncbi:hypothetical protein SAMN05518854_11437 [Variovorax sp. YR266]|nr:hypothetical protein SAMN05518854_11437 [Variovorax sp. YR266]